jgi:hypothetical protein
LGIQQHPIEALVRPEEKRDQLAGRAYSRVPLLAENLGKEVSSGKVVFSGCFSRRKHHQRLFTEPQRDVQQTQAIGPVPGYGVV